MLFKHVKITISSESMHGKINKLIKNRQMKILMKPYPLVKAILSGMQPLMVVQIQCHFSKVAMRVLLLSLACIRVFQTSKCICAIVLYSQASGYNKLASTFKVFSVTFNAWRTARAYILLIHIIKCSVQINQHNVKDFLLSVIRGEELSIKEYVTLDYLA